MADTVLRRVLRKRTTNHLYNQLIAAGNPGTIRQNTAYVPRLDFATVSLTQAQR